MRGQGRPLRHGLAVALPALRLCRRELPHPQRRREALSLQYLPGRLRGLSRRSDRHHFHGFSRDPRHPLPPPGAAVGRRLFLQIQRHQRRPSSQRHALHQGRSRVDQGFRLSARPCDDDDRSGSGRGRAARRHRRGPRRHSLSRRRSAGCRAHRPNFGDKEVSSTGKINPGGDLLDREHDGERALCRRPAAAGLRFWARRR